MKLWYFHPLNWRLAFQSIKWKYDRKIEIAYRSRMLDSMKRWEDEVEVEVLYEDDAG